MPSVHLPFVMNQLFNTPLLVNPSTAQMILSVMSGKMNIQSLVDDYDSLTQRDMQDLAAMGRMEASQTKAEAAHPGMAETSRDWTPYRLSESGIAIIPIKGVLRREWGVGPYSGATGYDGIWTQLVHAMENDKVKAIYLQINSGGGAVDGLFDLADAIYANSERMGGKPIWACAADHAYSAAYALASSADKVFVPALGGVGSIGAVIVHVEMAEYLENEGIKATIIRSKSEKYKPNEFERIDEQTLADLQAVVDEADDYFAGRVSLYRGIDKKSVHETNARVYTGQQALATGLVSDVLSEPEAWLELERYIA